MFLIANETHGYPFAIDCCHHLSPLTKFNSYQAADEVQ